MKLSGGEPPVVYDSFAGGGSIPLEALRLGCDTIGSDLNPIACLILRSELELLPRNGEALVDELQEAGRIISDRFRFRIIEYYVKEGSGFVPIAYLWARQATCESPACGVVFPLVGEFWLCKKAGHEMALRMARLNQESDLVARVFRPASSSEVPKGTVVNGRGRCPICGAVLENDRLRSQLSQYQGGIEQARLLAVVTMNPATGEKHYRDITEDDIMTAQQANAQLQEILKKTADQDSMIPNEPIPLSELRRISAPLYGCKTWQDLFLPRQRLSLYFLLQEIRNYVSEIDSKEVLPLLTLAFGKVVRHWNSNAKWHTKSENVAGAFGRQAIPMAYFFPEQFPIADDGAGSWKNAIDSVALASRQVIGLGNNGQSFRSDACDVPLPSESVNVWFTDPPYYDAVAYAHLADFFYVWVRRLMPQDPLFADGLIDKTQECVVDRPHSQSPSQKRANWFEAKMGGAMAEARRFLSEDGIASVVFAHKTTEGWEAIIAAMLRAGWVITASWPISTERGARLNARDNASLATSVHLVCRPRANGAPVGDWSEVLRQLPQRVGDWMERLQREHVRGADLVFACIGPALEIFSRYSKVETAEGAEVTLAEYLQKVWEVIGRAALEQVLGTAEAQARNGAAGALEEDARLTALFLWTLQSTNGEGADAASDNTEDEESDDDEEDGRSKNKPKGFSLIFDVARRFAQPLGIHLPEWEGRIIETKKGIVRLFAVSERAEQLFGSEGAQAVASRMEQTSAVDVQGMLFPEMEGQRAPKVKGSGRHINISDGHMRTRHEATTLDRVHAAMLLQSSGKSNALRALIKAELDKGSEFLRLGNALSALYPTGSEEKRLVDAMLLAVPR
jgi:adenine-specific DNA methylase